MRPDPRAHWQELATAIEDGRAAVRVGLWRSEALLAERFLRKSDRLLEVGCGGGRAALGLLRLTAFLREAAARLAPLA